MHLAVTIYNTIISKIHKFTKKFKNSMIAFKKHNPGEWYHTRCLYAIGKLSDCNCRRRGILQLLYIITLFQISKIRQKFKNSPIVKKTTQVNDIILDACMQ